MTKRVLSIALAVLAAAGLIGLSVTAARPHWLPAWARLGQTPRAATAGPFCKEHGVPERFCTICHEALRKTLPLCEEHGNIPEEICTRCHPEGRAKYQIETCPEGHGLPRAFCVECGRASSASASLPDDGWCALHNTPEAHCLACAEDSKKGGPGAAGDRLKACNQPLPVVKLASAKLVRQVGIQTAAVTEEAHAHKLTANAETAYDANRYAEVSPRVTGFLREVRADLGQTVRRGDVLAVADSAEVSTAKSQLISAHSGVRLAQATADRIQALTRSGVVAGKAELEVITALNQAQARAMDAEQKLRNLGFDEDQLTRILETKDTRNLLEVVSPISGSVVLRHAVRGEAIQSTTQLFAIADTSRMWLWIDIYESDITSLAPGQPVAFTISGTEDQAFAGKVTWVGAEVNPTTRTTRVRAELVNAEGRLRANQFGRAEIQVGIEHKAVVVPKAAVQRKDRADVVFLAEREPGSYRAQRVVTRPTDRSDVVEVTWGLKPGQRVVTRGAFLLKTEIMKGAIGAGCCQ